MPDIITYFLKKRNKKIAPPYGEREYQHGRSPEEKSRRGRNRRRFIKSPKLKKYLELHTSKESEDDLGTLYAAYTMLTKKEP